MIILWWMLRYCYFAELDYLSARADLPSGTFTSGCGHHMHAECWRRYFCSVNLDWVSNLCLSLSLSLSVSLSLSLSCTLKLSRKQASRTPAFFLLSHSWSICPVAEWRVPVPPLPVLWQHSTTTDAAHQTVFSIRQLSWKCGDA